MKKFAFVLSCLFVVACGDTEPDETPSISKDQAAQQGGKSDSGIDFCQLFDWYGDGICDGFCPQPDPDCEVKGQNCGARAGDTCGDDEYCAYVAGEYCGAADAESVCKPRPEFCTFEYAPVCGCDGKTYSNTCTAASSGTGVLHNGECESACLSDSDCDAADICVDGTCETPTLVSCGARAGDTCRPDEYCAYEPGAHCGGADAQAICLPRPEFCAEIYAPVCGCDGSTYSNECDAASNGTGVLHVGECEVRCASDSDCAQNEVCVDGVCEERVAGTCNAQTDSCGPNEYCDYKPGDECGSSNFEVSCEIRPQFCPEVYAPVCGCDGETYGNSCDANAAGVGVLSDGPCEPEGKICGGILGATCGPQEYCAYRPGEYCGQADASSTCEVRPQACPQVYDPVCGCDGRTYSNACSAAAAGQGTYSEGPCTF